MTSVKSTKKTWLLPITCLIVCAVLLVMNDLRFHIHQKINIPKYIKTNFDIFDALEDPKLLYDGETGQIVLTNQTRKDKPTHDAETIPAAGKLVL